VGVAARERDRVAAVRGYGLLDEARPTVLDGLTRLAARLFDTPMSAVTLIDEDRQWYAGNTGLDGTQSSRDASFCAHLVTDPAPLIVPDARRDARFREHPGVTGDPHVVFYAGVPLVDEDGHVLGGVCVIDRRPRRIGDNEVRLLADLAGQAAGHLSAIRDRTRTEVLGAELARLTRREEDFVAAVSHELRTPVTTIQGYLELLVEEDDLAPYRSLVEPIRRNGDRLVRMVDHLLAGTRPATGTPAGPGGKVDLGEAVRAAADACGHLAGTRGVRVTLTGDEPGSLYAVGEHADLCQALEHLVRNAVAFSPAGAEVRVRTAPAGDGARIEVADSGAGIPPAELPHVFERFYRGRHAQEQAVPGMGLGLGIARRIVTAHGGRLAVTSPGAGRGAVAEVWLPTTW
jgi:signal transduction histidine kinase